MKVHCHVQTQYLMIIGAQELAVCPVVRTTSTNPALLYDLDLLILKASSIFILRSSLDKAVCHRAHFTLFN